MQKITPFLWFDANAEEAVNFYVSLFPNSRVLESSRQGEGGPGAVVSMRFVLEGQEFIALNGGPNFKFSEAISFMVNCKTQTEVDFYWDNLSAGGEEQPCGWLKDRFGLSWQIIPDALGQALGDPDPEKAQRALQAMFQMKKIDIAAIELARAG